MLVTQVATATAALTWIFAEWMVHGKPSALGVASGAVAGLVAITPASGYVGPEGALLIGIACGLGCYFAVVKVKRAFGYDDSLDAFGVHGIGGMIGAILTGIFADASFGGIGLAEGVDIAGQLTKQVIGVLATVVYCGVASFIILKIIDLVIGLRVVDEDEEAGLDLAMHDEQGYNLTSILSLQYARRVRALPPGVFSFPHPTALQRRAKIGSTWRSSRHSRPAAFRYPRRVNST